MANTAYTTGEDSAGKMVRRNLSPARWGQLLARVFRSLASEGAEATWRKLAFRLNVALGRPFWQYACDRPTRKELRRQKKVVFKHEPLISILVPLYNTPPVFLRQMIESCTAQSYSNWQLCLADASADAQVGEVVAGHKDARITYKKLGENLGIAGNTNAAADMAKGEYIALLDHDDVLYPNALFEVVQAINDTGAEFLYSDEIVLGGEGLQDFKAHHVKPDFAPDYLRGNNYITHLSVFKTSLFYACGPMSGEYDGAQDHDIILRITEKANKVHHIPKMLYVWRAHEGSTAGSSDNKNYAYTAGVRAVAAQLERLGLKGEVEMGSSPGTYRVKYEVQGAPLVSVVIPNKDHAQDLRRCVNSFHAMAGYENYEIIIVENNSTAQETWACYDELCAADARVKTVQYVGGFNFSAICNLGVQNAAGEYILLLNNDLEFISPAFLPEMLGYAQREDVGAVGAKLIYPQNETIQHAGVFVGLGGSAGHSHKGHARGSEADRSRLNVPQNMLAVTGACLMTKTKLYRDFGGLDEEAFAVAYNDVDYCLRLWRAGYLSVFTPYVQAYHYEGLSRGSDSVDGSTQTVNTEYNAERDAFREKYADIFRDGDPFYNPHLTLKDESYAFDAGTAYTSVSQLTKKR